MTCCYHYLYKWTPLQSQKYELQSYPCGTHALYSMAEPSREWRKMYKQGKLPSWTHFISQIHTQNKMKTSCHHALLHHSYCFYVLPLLGLMLQENGFHCSRTGSTGTSLNIYSQGWKITIRKYETTFLNPITECDSFCSDFNEMQNRLSAQKNSPPAQVFSITISQ